MTEKPSDNKKPNEETAMNQLLIPIHSVVDVITNSPSVIYTEASASAAKVAKEIINEILEIAGSDKTADDLFTFKIVDMPDNEDAIFYLGGSYGDPIQRAKLPPFPVCGCTDGLEQEERHQAWAQYRADKKEYLTKNADLIADLITNDEDFCEALRTKLIPTLVVTAKDGKNIALASKALSMFNQEAEYDG